MCSGKQNEEHKIEPTSNDPGDKYFHNRDIFIWKFATQWLKAKRINDECEGLWRIHDDLYDLTGWEKHHPGGRNWLDLTRGTDCTEAFETYHVFGVSESLLKKFWVKKATTPRRYRFTFHPDGFYKTLQRKGARILKETGVGPDWSSSVFQDLLTLSFLVCFAVLCQNPTIINAFITGLFLGMSNNCCHNWFHLGDKHAKWRRFYFDLSLVGSQEWRISHALSHHLYTNTYTDLEVSSVEPLLQYLPIPKGQIRTVCQHFVSHLFAAFSYPAAFILRHYLIIFRDDQLLPEHVLPWMQLICLGVATQDFYTSLLLWLTYHCVAGYMLVIQKTTTHHGPELYHAGDELRHDRDWGLHMLDTTRDMDKSEQNYGVMSKPLVYTTFGNHLLHHMFPTVDHSKLDKLYPALFETLAEFGEKFDFKTLPELLSDYHAQLDRTEPKTNIFNK